MLRRRPFESPEVLFSAAEFVWWGLEPSDWLEASSAHPKIGEKKLSGWASQEQAGIGTKSHDLMERLARANEDYENRFGWIFLVCATGKTAPEMLHSLQARLENEREEELRVAAGEQAKITKLRLEKLLGE